MMPTRSACTCDAYSVLSGLNGVWAAYPGRRRKPLFAAFTCALGFHTSARWGLRAHEIIGTFPCSRTGSPSASSKNMWGMTSVSTLGWDAAALWSHGPMVPWSYYPMDLRSRHTAVHRRRPPPLGHCRPGSPIQPFLPLPIPECASSPDSYSGPARPDRRRLSHGLQE